MKKHLLIAYSVALLVQVYAQPSTFPSDKETPINFERIKPQPVTPPDSISEWFNYGTMLYDYYTGSGTDVKYFRYYLFPDSTVQVGISSGTPYYVTRHSFGEVFDPTSSWFYNSNNTPLESTDAYYLDTIRIYYKYYRFHDSVPDTLVVQVFEHSKINFYPSASWDSTISYGRLPYNYQQRKGDSPSYEYYYLLENKDTITTNIGYIDFPVGIMVNAGQKVAATFTYFPGHPFNVGDTIEVADGVNPVNKVNAFAVYYFRDDNKTKEKDFYNNGLWVTNTIRYNVNTSGWNGKYIPGVAYSTGYYYTDMGFKITHVVSTDEIARSGKQWHLFPNNINRGENIFISSEANFAKNDAVAIFDLTGRKLVEQKINNDTGKELEVNTSSLKSGMYLLKLTSGNNTYSEKFVVQ